MSSQNQTEVESQAPLASGPIVSSPQESFASGSEKIENQSKPTEEATLDNNISNSTIDPNETKTSPSSSSPSSPVPLTNSQNNSAQPVAISITVQGESTEHSDKPQNTKQLPQIDQSPDLIARIVKGIRIAAQAAQQESNAISQAQTQTALSPAPSSPPSSRTSSLSFSLSRPFSLSSPPPNANNTTPASSTPSTSTTPSYGGSTSPAFSSSTSSSISTASTTAAPSTFSFSSTFSSVQYSPLVMSAINESGLKLVDFTRDTARKYMIDGAEVKDFAPLVFPQDPGTVQYYNRPIY
eukprot:TRINITY_DN7972_c0_g1_i1.p1 TRINITY_DN7972_c0_g1~~TRINITY_DN7972_c0_g1_i1.p1  ORF type:complete len:296 (+),score=81.09 TRINITY_DN7972_c0_g1_i1:84-971(+)